MWYRVVAPGVRSHAGLKAPETRGCLLACTPVVVHAMELSLRTPRAAALTMPLPCVAHSPALCAGNNKWGGYFIFNDTDTLTTITGKPGASNGKPHCPRAVRDAKPCMGKGCWIPCARHGLMRRTLHADCGPYGPNESPHQTTRPPTVQIRGGAAQNDPNKGWQVGSVKLTYTPG